MSETGLVIVTNDNFEVEVLRSGLPVMAFFYQYFFDCLTMEGLATSFASMYDGKVKVVKIDRDTDPALVERCDVSDVPTFLFFKDGHETGNRLSHTEASAIHHEIKKMLT